MIPDYFSPRQRLSFLGCYQKRCYRNSGSNKTGGYYVVEEPNKKKETKPTQSISSKPVQEAKPKRKKRIPRHKAQPQNAQKQEPKE